MKIVDIKIGIEEFEGSKSLACRIETDEPRTLGCATPWHKPLDKEVVALMLRNFASAIDFMDLKPDVASGN